MKKTVVIAIALLVALPASAQKAQTGERAPVVIDMDADIIEGGLDKPDVVMIPRGVKREFRSLIRMRKSFTRELLASAGQLGSGAGSSIGR